MMRNKKTAPFAAFMLRAFALLAASSVVWCASAAKAQSPAPVAATQSSQSAPSRVFPVKRAESRAQWRRDGRRAVRRARALVRQRVVRARNVILFVGDGMGVSTVAAARILAGQQAGASGEENLLSFERLPHVAFSKTYSANGQTPDSASTMTAIITGAKTKDGMISVAQDATPGDHASVTDANELPTLLELAERRGLSTGVVSTARLTHATPAACYAHSPDREWEADSNLPPEARRDDFPDIARQLIEFPYGDGLEVALGGGRAKFLPREIADPEEPDKQGERTDRRDLTTEWTKRGAGSAYVWNKAGFDAVNPRRTRRLLGLFERSHLKYEHDRARDAGGEPSLAEMTAKAISILAKNRRGYVLMVEAGRIDHAHHDGNAYRALTETIELSNAVRAALRAVNLRDTLVVVTADHSHAFTFGGYPARGNDILGYVRETDAQGEPSRSNARDRNAQPYTTLGYANGPGARPANTQPANAQPADTQTATTDPTAPDYLQAATTPLTGETHAGEDVPVYATGAGAHLFHGVQEQNYIFHALSEALGFNRRLRKRQNRLR